MIPEMHFPMTRTETLYRREARYPHFPRIARFGRFWSRPGSQSRRTGQLPLFREFYPRRTGTLQAKY